MRIVALKRDDKFLVVNAVGIGRVELDVRVFAPDANMLGDHLLALFFGERIPGTRFDERVHEQVARVARFDANAFFGVRAPVFRQRDIVQAALGPGEERARHFQERPQCRVADRGFERLKRFDIFRDRPQQKVHILTHANQGIRPQQHPAVEAAYRVDEVEFCIALLGFRQA